MVSKMFHDELRDVGQVFYAHAALALVSERAQDTEADGDAVWDLVVGSALDRMAEGVSEVEEEAFVLIELVDLDEVLLGERGSPG